MAYTPVFRNRSRPFS